MFYSALCVPGAVCPPGPVPLPGLALVPAGQEGPGRRVLVGPSHRAAVQQAGQRRAGVVPVAHEAAQPAEGAAAGEMDQRGGGQPPSRFYLQMCWLFVSRGAFRLSGSTQGAHIYMGSHFIQN